MTVFVGIGSNLGDREANLLAACHELRADVGALRGASLYETVPRDYTDQPLFLNTVLTGSTELAPLELLERIHDVERRLGRDRERERRFGARTIDLDILVYGNAVLRLPGLSIPHPRMRERKFVLVPLVELAPDLVDPETGVPFSTYLERLPPQGIYYFPSRRYSHDLESNPR